MVIGISGKINSGKDTVAQMIQGVRFQERYGQSNSKILELIGRDYESLSVESGYLIKRFADTLKDITCMLIGCTREQLEDREFKESPLGEEWRIWYKQGNVMHYDSTHKRLKKGDLHTTRQEAVADILGKPQNHDLFDVEVVSEVLTPRKLMQLLGTEAGREILHPNIWVNALFADYKKKPVYSNKYPQQYEEPKWIIPDTRFPNEAKAIRDRDGILIRINRPTDGTRILSEKEKHPSEVALDSWDDWDYVINNNGTLEDLLEKVRGIYNELD